MITFLLGSLAFGEPDASDPVLDAMVTELNRSFEALQKQETPPYWMQLAITEHQYEGLTFSDGALFDAMEKTDRVADVDVRVGNWTLDNTHPLIDGGYFSDEPTHFRESVPIGDDPLMIRRSIWKIVDQAYRTSVRRLIKIESNRSLKVELEDQSDDWSPTEGFKQLETVPNIQSIHTEDWKTLLRTCSAQILEHPNILSSSVRLTTELETRWITTTDDVLVREVRPHARLAVMTMGIAEDGMQLETYEYIDAYSIDNWTLETCTDLAAVASDALDELMTAPIVDPFVGPAILRGKAAAVFFHEILGHRIEGHRQKDEDEGQTLTDKVGQSIFPDFITVIDDPSRTEFDGIDLNGHYRVDDEGVKAQTVSIVDKGVLQGFLMGRSPVENFPVSNGHGRRQTGYGTVARQGNLIVSAEESVSYDDLKAQLIEEIKRQDKPFGLIFDDISGGFTFTGRNSPNSYVVKPVTVWRVYPDGREEMVRGVDMIGTPLITFSRIMAASDESQVFNGMCGAESGWVPVSAIAPDLLIQEVEIQRRSKDHDKPPILDAPVVGGEQ